MRAWKAGNVGIANAPGAGVADDKVVYAWVPDLIRYYLGEEPLIAERADVSLPVRRRAAVRARQHRRARRQAGQRERRLRHRDRQPGDRRPSSPTRSRRSRPTRATGWPSRSCRCRRCRRSCGDAIEPRHVDLRPFILTGATSYVTAGGLTRVALPKGSLVVNSSQGGGSKDTWIVDLRRRTGGRTDVALLSRVADRLYWARPLRRAGRGHGPHRARLHRPHRRPPDRRDAVRWEPLVAIAGNVSTRSSSPTTTSSGELRSCSSSSSPTATTRAASPAAWRSPARTCAPRAR